jgi:DNA-binding Lrp family transcriptional regulator
MYNDVDYRFVMKTRHRCYDNKMVFSTEDKHLICELRKSKFYGSKRLLSEFPEKQWSRRGLDHLLKKIDITGTVNRKPGSGKPRTARSAANIAQVAELIESQEDLPQTHRSQRQISREVGISRRSVREIIKDDLSMKCRKRCTAQALTEANKLARFSRSKKLHRRYPEHMVPFIFFTDEKIFTLVPPRNSQNDRLYLPKTVIKRDVEACRLLRTRSNFSSSIMVSVGVSKLGCTDVYFVEPGTKVNGEYYRDVLLSECLLPDMKRSSDFFIFQQDNAPAHRAKDTITLLKSETPELISPDFWPPNSPDLNPVDYQIWGHLQERVYRNRIHSIEELKACIKKEWERMDQGIVNRAIDQWRTRLRACFKANGGHFEYKL